MNEEKIEEISNKLGRELCNDWVERGFCDNCPYFDLCDNGHNALIATIREFLKRTEV